VKLMDLRMVEDAQREENLVGFSPALLRVV
jgi:hypothetical protein